MFWLSLSLAPVHAATYTVTSTAGSGAGTLRDAIAWANSHPNGATPDEITFDSSVFGTTRTISLSSALPDISDDVTVTGPGANLLTVTASTNTFYVLTVNSGKGLTIRGLTINNASCGIYNNGSVNATNCTFSGNDYGIGNDYGAAANAINCTFRDGYDGIDNLGTVTATNCTFSGNTDFGLYSNAGTANATNCTFSGNYDGFYNDWGTANATNCTFSGNTYYTLANSYGTMMAVNCTLSGNNFGVAANVDLVLRNSICAGNSTDVFGPLDPSSANNITGGDPKLAPLADNGGPTQTMALLPGSPAINAGNNSLLPSDTLDLDGDGNTTESLPFDQRGNGFPRIQNGTVDIGAYEFANLLESLVVTTTADEDNGTSDPAFGTGTSLREAIIYANSHANGATPDEITFDNGVFGTVQTISLSGELPHISDDVSITGPGAALLTVRAGVLFTVNIGKSLTLCGMTIDNASFGIVNDGSVAASNCTFSSNDYAIASGGTVVATNCTFSGNNEGIYSGGTANAANCTFSGNYDYAFYNNGGTANAANCTFSGNLYHSIASVNGTVEATNCTVSGNYFGIASNSIIYLKNTICAGNSENVYGPLGSAGSITSGTAAEAGLEVDGSGNPVLKDNGGPTQTIALLPGSPAIDAGYNSLVIGTTDQRGNGFPRIQHGTVDIGAYEYGPFNESLVVTTTADENNGTSDPAFGTGTSLREAIAWANFHANGPTPDEITFNIPAAQQSGGVWIITLGGTLPNVSDDVTITGPGANLLTLKGSIDIYYVLFVNGGKGLTIRGLTIDSAGDGIVNYGTVNTTTCIFSGNYDGVYNYGSVVAANCTFSGGRNGIINEGTANTANCTYSSNSNDGIANSGTTTATSCTFRDNYDGITNSGTTMATNCTFTYNSYGIRSNGTVDATNCTFSVNVTGIDKEGGTFILKNSICAGNTLKVDGTLDGASANNLTDGDPKLGPPADNGGPTQTMALLPGSPAINAGNNILLPADTLDLDGDSDTSEAIPFDQRGSGFRRIQYGTVDIGAYEYTSTIGSLVVTTTADEDNGTSDPAFGTGTSLREAIAYANSHANGATPDEITFDSGVFGSTLTITLGGALPSISDDVSITGPGANLLTVRASTQTFDLITVNGGKGLTIHGLTLNNAADGIYNLGTLNVVNCTLSGTAYYGIINDGTLNAVNCTFSDNNYYGIYNTIGTTNAANCTFSANGFGINNNGMVNVTNCTFSDNSYGIRSAGTVTATNCTLSGNGTGIDKEGGTVTLKNSICAGNLYNNVKGTLDVDTNNLTSGDPMLGPLQDNGGPTQTMALQPGSPAINTGDSSLATDPNGNPLPFDQRGSDFPRIQGSRVDKGAYEYGPFHESLVVTTIADEDDNTSDPAFGSGTSLREAIAWADIHANGATPDEITFSGSAFGTAQTITVHGALPRISDDVIITGPGAALLKVDNYPSSYLLTVDSGKGLTICGLTLGLPNYSTIYNEGRVTATNCTISSSGGHGIDNLNILTATNCTFRHNQSGIFNMGTVNAANCSFSGNGSGIKNSGWVNAADCTFSANYTCGIDSDSRAPVIAVNCTFSGNKVGINIAPGTNFGFVLKNSICAGNGTDVIGTLNATSANNIITGTAAEAGLEVDGSGNPILKDNGGPTWTIALLPGSPAVNTGANSLLTADPLDLDGDGNTTEPLPTDQRGNGFPRIRNATVDIGAYEYDNFHESLVVTTIADEGNGTSDPAFGTGTSLREAIAWANSHANGVTPDEITFNIPAAQQSGDVWTLTVGGELPRISDDVILTGPGAGLLTVRASIRTFNPLSVNSGAGLTIRGLTLDNGNCGLFNQGMVNAANCTFTGNVFGIYNDPGGTANAVNCTLSGNNFGTSNEGTMTATNCTISGNGYYGIVNRSTLTVANCTISGNAHFCIVNPGTITAINCTISGNDSSVSNDGGTFFLLNSICAGNGTDIDIEDGTWMVSSSITSGTAAEAGLEVDGSGNPVLKDNGGPTQTIALLPGSRAVNAGENGLAIDVGGNPLPFDQRGSGFPRILGNIVDMGAYEFANFQESMVVTTAVDEDNGTSDPAFGSGTSLREAINYANSHVNGPTPDAITFDNGVFGTAQTITLGGELPHISDDVTISGPGAAPLTVKGSTQSFNMLTVNSGKGLTARLLTLDNAVNGIYNEGTVSAVNCTFSDSVQGTDNLGTMTIVNCTFSGNVGVGIYNRGTLIAANCTFSGNDDALYNIGTANAVNCTLSGNPTGIYTAGTFILKNSICAGNTVDVNGTLDGASANNLTSGDPKLGPLQDNGGPTQTMALLPGSPGINTGDNSLLPADTLDLDGDSNTSEAIPFDQRGSGFPRIQYGTVDMGAYEYNSAVDSLVVTTTVDEDNGTSDPAFGTGSSLREALTWANRHANGATPDEITFDSTVFGTVQTITLGSALPSISDNVSIAGPGAALLTVKGGINTFDLLTVNSGKGLNVRGLALNNAHYNINSNGTVTAANCTFSGNYDGISNRGRLRVANCAFLGNNYGVYNDTGGTANAVSSTFSGNGTYGFYNRSMLTIVNCTFSGNSTGMGNRSMVTATNCTLSGNGTGIYTAGTFVLKNSICAGNTTNVNGILDVASTHNLTSGDPKLGPLADNGGPTQTMALLSGSPALEAGDSSLLPADTLDLDGDGDTAEPLPFDQRGSGFPRILGNTVDIGAYEAVAQSDLALAMSDAPDPVSAGTQLTYTITLANNGPSDAQNVTVKDPLPAHTTFVSAAVTGSGWTTSKPLVGGTGTVAFGRVSVPSSGSEAITTFTVVVTVDASTAIGTVLSNTATASSTTTDPTPGNNDATATTTVTEAPSLVVTTDADVTDAFDGWTSLREAIAYADSKSGDDTITFSDGSGGAVNFQDDTPETIILSGTELTINSNVTITGPGAKKLTVSGNQVSRVFRITAGQTGVLSGLTIANGSAESATVPDGNGGGLLNEGRLTLRDCVLTGNVSGGNTERGDGGAVYHQGLELSVDQCTFTSNRANGGGHGAAIAADSGAADITASTFNGNNASDGNGGAIANIGSAMTITNATFTENTAVDGGAILHDGNTLTLIQCTIAGNAATSGGGGIERVGRVDNTLILRGCIVAGNTAPNGPDAYSHPAATDGAFTSQGYNLIGNAEGALGFTPSPPAAIGDLVGTSASPIDPRLLALADNGGPTQTMALDSVSPAINAGNNSLATDPGGDPLSTDQRGSGFPRIRGGTVDIGAYEFANFQESIVVTTTADEDDGTSDPAFGTGTSLREAIAWANSHGNGATPDEITFDSSVFGTAQTITVGSALPAVSDDVILTGPGAAPLTVETGTKTFDLLTVNSGKGLIIRRVILNNARYGILNEGSVTAAECTLSGNDAGISNNGTAIVTNGTFSGNRAGIHNTGTTMVTNGTFSGNSSYGIDNAGTAILTNCTLSGNPTGIGNTGTFILKNSICAGNSTNVLGTLDAASTHNLTDGDPKLGPLQDNGGPTPTMALLPGSPAIDAGDNSLATDTGGHPLPTDQRGSGFPRIRYVRVDIGAYEFNGAVHSLVVTTTADEDDGTSDPAFGSGTSLREAINYANSHANGPTPDEITFDSSIFGTDQTITVGSALPSISDDVTITGPGADLLTVKAGTKTFDLLTVDGGKGLTICGLTLNFAVRGILNNGSVTAMNCTFSGDTVGIFNSGTTSAACCTFSGNGTGIHNTGSGTALMTNCTFSNGGLGSGMINDTGGTLTAINCTVSGNGRGISSAGTFVLKNSICAGNSTNVLGTLDAASTHNLIDGDPKLGPLAYNGGPTQTMALLPGSPAIDAGDNSLLPTDTMDLDGDSDTTEPLPFDQRGSGCPRIQGGTVDIGAYEIIPSGQTTVIDVMQALRIAGGLATASGDDMSRLDVVDPGAFQITLADAARLARIAAGLGVNP